MFIPDEFKYCEEGEILNIDEKMEVCNGPIKPDIVFFGECLPKKFEWGWERISSPPYLFPNES